MDDDDDLQPLAPEMKPRGILLPVAKKEGGEVERAGVTHRNGSGLRLLSAWVITRYSSFSLVVLTYDQPREDPGDIQRSLSVMHHARLTGMEPHVYLVLANCIFSEVTSRVVIFSSAPGTKYK